MKIIVITFERNSLTLLFIILFIIFTFNDNFVLFFIAALCTALNVGVRVEYMDRGEAEGGQVTAHDFPEGVKPKVYLLYRPGHYDILYPN